MLDLEAAVHHDREAALLRDPRTLGADHAELQPQRSGAHLDRFPRDVGHGGGSAEDVDHVDVLGDVPQGRVDLLAEHALLVRVHRDDAIAVPLQVVANEVARAELARREPDDRHGPRVEHDLLHRAPVLELVHAVTAEPRAACSPRSRSHTRSSTSSSPTDNRTVPGATPDAASSSSDSWRCVVEAGWMTRLFVSPTLARWLQSESASMNLRPPSRPLSRSNEKTEPAVVVPFPARTFVAEWMIRSAPNSSGRQRYGVANVLSTMSGAPTSCATAAASSMSSTLPPGFAIVSANSALVFAVTERRQPSGSSMSTQSTAIWSLRARWLSCAVEPP